MTPESVFSFANTMVLPGWLLLLLAPRWKPTGWIIHAGILPVVLGVIYLSIVGPAMFRGGLDFGSFGSLEGVMNLFSQPWVVVAGWVHYLAFDLWTGAWETRDAARVGLNHFLVIPCLVLTFMLGPVGLLLYFVLRWSITRKFAVE